MIQKRSEPSQRLLALVLSFMLSYLPLMTTINSICNVFISEGWIYDTALIFIVFFVMFFIAIRRYIRTVQIDVLSLFGLYAMMLLIGYFNNSRTIRYFWTEASDFISNPLYQFLLFSFGAYMLARRLTGCREFLRCFEWVSAIVIVLSAVQYNLGMNNEEVSTQYMAFSYNMLIQVAYMMIASIRKPKWYRVVLSIIGSILLFLAGCRGAVLALVIVVLLYLLFFKKFEASRTRILVLLAFVMGTAALMFLWKPMLTGLADLLESMNISSRNITILLEGDVLDDSGRSVYLDRVIQSINMISVNGFYSDRVLLGGTYPHNLFYEILYDFGLLLGVVLIGVLAWLYFGAFRTKNRDVKLLMVLLSAGIIRLLFSSSFLAQEPAFYILLALCVNVRLRLIQDEGGTAWDDMPREARTRRHKRKKYSRDEKMPLRRPMQKPQVVRITELPHFTIKVMDAPQETHLEEE
ncbi:MAG: hypothetical protein LBM28_06980 [Oscillospiraceae bacterium]|jgi:hypothetical protein|nr:hypothetical protein [Oscillospiraceae bacterium]